MCLRKSRSQCSALGPQAGERRCGPAEQQMVGLSKLSVHDGVEHRVDAAVEPGEVCTEHVKDPRCMDMFFSYVEQYKGHKAAHKTQEHRKAHASHTLEFAIVS